MTTVTRISIASIGRRRQSLGETIQSLAGQADLFRIYLNGYKEGVPSYLRASNVKVTTSAKHGWRGAESKFWWLSREPLEDVYEITCDDDIIYPPDYVRRMVEKVEEYKRRAIICVHASTLLEPMDSYVGQRKVYMFEEALAQDTSAHVPGTGTCVWHSSTMRFEMQQFESMNMCDIWVGLACQQQSVPVIAIERPARWLRQSFAGPGIFEETTKDDSIQTNVVKRVWPWKLGSLETRT